MAVAALDAGKHVLLEKPMATTLADAERDVAAAERSGRYLGVGLELRVSRQWARAFRELIAEARSAVPAYGNLTLFGRPFRPASAAGATPSRPRRLVDPGRADPPHRPAAVVLPRTRVADRGVGRRRAVGAGAGMHDAFTCTLRFADGAYAVLSQCVGGFEHSLLLEIAGDGGALRPGGPVQWTAPTRRISGSSCSAPARRTRRSSPSRNPARCSSCEEQLRRLVADVPRRTPLVSAREALPSLRVCLEIERALSERRPIALAWT